MNLSTTTKIIFAGLFAGAMLVPVHAKHPTAYAKPVDPVKASRSRLEADSIQLFQGIIKKQIEQFIVSGKRIGKQLFAEDFKNPTNLAKRWKIQCNVKTIPDGRGGNSTIITPVLKEFSEIALRPEAYVPVNPQHPIAVYWEARTPINGNPVFIRIDFFDSHKTRINANQIRSTTDPTQPTLFSRNAFYANKWMPEKAKFMRISFHQNPMPSDKLPAEVTNISIVDLDQAARDAFAKFSTSTEKTQQLADCQVLLQLPKIWQRFAQALALRPRPADEKNSPEVLRWDRRLQDVIELVEKGQQPSPVLSYTASDLCSTYPIMPNDFTLPGKPGDPLKIRDCAGEMTRGTIVLWSPEDWQDVTVEFSSLRKNFFRRLPATTMSAKIVKNWYQALGAPTSTLPPDKTQVLVPELLLHDDSLVIPDHDNKRNLVKYQKDGRQWYVDINTIYSKYWCEPIDIDTMPIRDARALQPFHLRADENKQLMIRFDIPEDAAAGTYEGTITLRSEGKEIATIPVQLEILPFRLPERPETFYSKDQEYTMGLYYWGLLSKDGKPYISVMHKSREQLLAEMKLMSDNSITNPIMIWGNNIIFNEQNFRTYLELAREAGLKDNLYLGSSGNIGNPTKPEDLKKLQLRLRKAMDIAAEYGFKQVYFYGFDEVRGEKLVSQIPAWKAAREVGAKILTSGYAEHFKKVGKYLDICNFASDFSEAHPEEWHSIGHKIWKYNSPQAGCEDPNIYRRNYGLFLWKRGFDGGNTYCLIGQSSCWNDLHHFLKNPNATSRYRGMCMAYQTMDGAIETLSITGLHDAMKDVRYMSLLRKILRQKPNDEIQKWFDSIDFNHANLPQIRQQTIDHILKLLQK